MPLTIKTRDELIRAFKDHIRGGIPGADTSPGSDYDLTAKADADVFRGNQGQAKYLAQQILPASADIDHLMRHAAWRKLVQQPAAGAQGYVALTAPSGTDTLPQGSTLTHADGTVYETTAPATIALPGWSGKTIADGSTVSRLIVAPNTTGMSAGDSILVDGSHERVIKAVVSTIDAIDLYEPLAVDPGTGDTIAAARGVVASVEAQTEGASTNKEVGDSVTVDSPVGAIESTARVLELSGGGDLETEAEFRSRIQAFDVEGRDATAEYYRGLARTCPGVRIADAFVYPNFRGMGAHDIFLIGVEGARLVSSVARSAVGAWVLANRSAADDVAVWALNLAEDFGVTVSVLPKAGYEADWEGLFTTAAGCTTTKLNLSADPTGIIEIGDRILATIDLGGGKTPAYLRTVSNVASSYVEITVALPSAPSIGQGVFPAGPLTEPVTTAIASLFDLKGPGRSTSASDYADIWERYPAPPEWDEWYRVSELIATVQGVTGVESVKTGVLPASDQYPVVQSKLVPKHIQVKYAS